MQDTAPQRSLTRSQRQSVGQVAARYGGCGTLLLAGALSVLLPGCSTEPREGNTSTPVAAVSDTPTAAEETAMQRVVVTLKATEPAGVDKAIEHLRSSHPGLKVVRTMPAFSQLVVELPGPGLNALSADPVVRSAQPDAPRSTMKTP